MSNFPKSIYILFSPKPIVWDLQVPEPSPSPLSSHRFRVGSEEGGNEPPDAPGVPLGNLQPSDSQFFRRVLPLAAVCRGTSTSPGTRRPLFHRADPGQEARRAGTSRRTRRGSTWASCSCPILNFPARSTAGGGLSGDLHVPQPFLAPLSSSGSGV